MYAWVPVDVCLHNFCSVLFSTPPDVWWRFVLSHRAGAKLLKCVPAQLCKIILLENKGFRGTPAPAKTAKPWTSRVFGVVLQYVETLDTDALVAFLRRSAASSDGTMPPALAFSNLMLAENGTELSGFSHNAVTPYGMLTPVPIVVSESAASQPLLWLGGGAVDVKLRLAPGQLLATLNATVAPCTTPRAADELEAESFT